MTTIKKIHAIVLSLLLLCCVVWPRSGWCMTSGETTAYKQIPIGQWTQLTAEWAAQKSELMKLQDLYSKLRRPSEQLQQELQEAKRQLQTSQKELTAVNLSLTAASSELAASKTSLQTLRHTIDKERRVQRRQIWQNRFWFFIAGAAVGAAAAK